MSSFTPKLVTAPASSSGYDTDEQALIDKYGIADVDMADQSDNQGP